MTTEELMKLKTDKARKDVMRDELIETVFNAIKAKYGECYIVKKEASITENDTIVKKNTIVVPCGDIIDKDGFLIGAAAEISIKIKTWSSCERKNGTSLIGVTIADYMEIADNEL